MSFFGRLLGRKDDGNVDEPAAMPWDQSPSMLTFIRSHIVADQSGLTQAGRILPDEERVTAGSKIRWAPGAHDGVGIYHMERGDNNDSINKTMELVLDFCRQPTAKNKAAVYRHIVAESVAPIIDSVIEKLVQEKRINQVRLHELARSLVTEAPDREPVKFGIALLGLFRNPADQELYQVLGRHDEFTLFCAVALANSSDEPDDALWTLARNVTGWGRIHAIERLAKTSKPEIKDWLLRDGFRNSVMNEYLAATCARAGGLRNALLDDDVDRTLLTAAGEIIEALINGGPAEGIDDYDDAQSVIASYLHHMAISAETVRDFLHVHAIKRLLDRDDSKWLPQFEAGWTPENRDSLRAKCASILGWADWSTKVQSQLTSTDDMEFHYANLAAQAIGIPTWDIHWQRLQHKPTDGGRWYDVMIGCDEPRLTQVLEFAAASLDLNTLATGAADELGIGPGFERHSCLDFVLQELRRFPRRGATLIEAGLRSPVVRNRNMAIVAVAAWPRDEWPASLENAVRVAALAEPCDEVRENLQKVLNGEPLSN